VVPVPPDEQEAADRRPDRDAEVRGDAHRRVRRLVPLGGDQVGDHRLVGGAAQRAEDGQQREQPEAEVDVPADGDQRERDERLAPPAGEDQRPAPDLVRPVAADVPRDAGEDGADEVGERERRLRGPELLHRPDAHERVRRRAGDRADEADGEHRAQRAVDVAAPDETEETRDEFHRTSRVRETSQKDPSTAGPMSAANATVPIPTRPPRRNPTTSTDASSTARTTPIRARVRSEPTSISESRGPAPSAAPM